MCEAPRVTRRTALDRAAQLRKKPDALEALLDQPTTLLVPVWRNKVLVTNDDPVRPQLIPVGRATALLDRGYELVFLGLLDSVGKFAVDVSALDEPLADAAFAGKGSFEDLRVTGSLLDAYDFGLLAFARGILHWHRQARYCGRCAAPTRPREGGHVRECGACEAKHFPRTDPAVMILITRGDSCLLARQPAFPANMYSTLAGFVEPGETIEECVVRETAEEVGLNVTGLRYFRSQSWPFPQSLMIGWFAATDSSEITLDRDELEDARWFTRAELAEPRGFFCPPRVSLAHHMIAEFVANGA